MASITARTRKDGSTFYRVSFRIAGKQCEDRFDDEKAASKFVRLVNQVGGERARKLVTAQETPSAPTLSEWMTTYLEPSSGLISGITEGTRAGYRREAARSFLQHDIADLPIDMISEADVAAWVTWQEKQPTARTASKPKKDQRTMSAKTIKNCHSLLSSALNAAVKKRIISFNPARGTRITKGRVAERTFLTPAEYRTLLSFIPERWKPLVELLAATGMRWGEATALTWNDLDASTTPPTIRIDKAWKKAAAGHGELGAPKSERSNRTVAVPQATVALLGQPAEDRTELIFPSETGGPLWPQHFHQRVWKRAVEAANDKDACEKLGLSPISKRPRVHDLRHSHVSWLIHAGVPLPVIQRRLGHEKITTTVDTYGHIMPDAQVAVVAAMDQLMLGT